MARRWSFHSVALASGASPLEVQACDELVGLLAADPKRSSWQRACSYRVVRRAQLEDAARAATLAESARQTEGGPPEDGANEAPSTEPTTHSASVAVTEMDALDVAATPSELASAFQRLVDQDKRDFEQFTAESTSSGAGDDHAVPTEGPDSASSPLEDCGGASVSPARIYLLLDYPASLEEIDALLRLRELGCERTQLTDDLPLLPLIDGALLLVDPLKGLQSRRKGSSVGSRRASVSPTKFDDLGVLDAFVPPSALPASPFVTASPSISTFYQASSVGGLEWSDFVFTDVACTRIDPENPTPVQLKLAQDLVKEVVDTLERLATDKFAFKDWVQATKVYSVPSSQPQSDTAQRLVHKYHRLLRSTFPASVSVSTVVFALRESVARAADNDMNGEEVNEDDDEEDEQTNLGIAADSGQEFIEYGDQAARRVARACACRDALRLKGNPATVATADGAGIAEIERVMWQMSDLPGVGNGGRKAFPVVPMLSQIERKVLETEFASFCPPGIAVPQVHLTRQLLQLEEILGATWKGKVQTREFAELLNARVFPQRLAQVLLRSPTVYKSYYPPTDALLLACITATAPGRFRTSFWSAREHVRHRPAFKDWKKERAMAPEYLTPRTAEAAMACVPLSSAELEAVAEKSWVFYPEDHSIVRLHQNPRGDTWLSVYQNRNVFGLRPPRLHPEHEEQPSSGAGATHVMQFAASFDDESRLHVCEGQRQFPRKPDGFSTVTVTNSFPCGLVISAGSDGSIVQRYIHYDVPVGASQDDNASDDNQDEEDGPEAYRVIYGRGCVLRVFHGGAGQILTPEGDVYSVVKQPDGSFQRVTPIRRAGSMRFSATTFTVDPETNTLVERRASGVMVATHTDGARITYHLDGSRMYSDAQSTHVLVHKHSFADVTIDLNVNLTAQRHASGERVAVTKGGLRTRSTVTVYDGTTIDVAYNTRVTAQVNGRVTTTKPDGTVIVAKDSGRIEYSPAKRAMSAADYGRDGNSPMRTEEEDNDRDVVSHNGVYYFDIRLGRFELCDREQNVFLVETGDGSTAPRASIDLAGIVSAAEAQKYDIGQIPAKATINDPIQPHVFILNGDGTALEILSPCEVADYITEVSASGALSALDRDQQKTPLQLPREFLASLVVMHPWDGVNCGPSAPVFNDEALTQHLMGLRRPVATVGKHLPDYFAEFDSPKRQRSVIARRLWTLQPLSIEQMGQIQSAWDSWKRWQDEREANKDRFKVVDPRDADAIAQEAAMQKRVLAAYKAARARKKLEKQRARELRLAAASKGAQMETVPEGAAGEEKDGEQAQDDEDDYDFDQFGSEASDDGTCDDSGADVDDPMTLLWTGFSQADDSASGVLTMTQTRQALVHALGTGVTAAELSAALSQRFRVDLPFKVSFDLFVDLVDHFKRVEDEQGANESKDSKHAGDKVPRLCTPSASAFGPPRHLTTKLAGSGLAGFDDARPASLSPVAVGSGARAVWQRQTLNAD